MKQVIQYYKDGRISLEEVPEPFCKAGGVTIRLAASLISPGTEKQMIAMGRKSLLGKARARPDLVRQAWLKARKEGFVSVFQEALRRLDEPIPLGYSAAGTVLQVGAGVTRFKTGDRVAAAGAGFASHAEVVWVPENLCLPIPPGVDFEAAAFVMLGGIALQGVREAGLTLGETGVVIGLGLLGLLSVQLLGAMGCRVIGVDLDRRKADLAKELQAELVLVSGEDDVAEAVANFTGGKGADGVVITVGSRDSAPIRLAESIARERARLVLVGTAELQLSRQTFWEKELSFTVSKAAGPGSLKPPYEIKGLDYPISLVRWTEGRNLAAFLELARKGRVRVEPLITHRFDQKEALSAYDLIQKNREPYIGILFKYPDQKTPVVEVAKSLPRMSPQPPQLPLDRLNVGLVGGGGFTRNILLPALRKVKGVKLAGVATTSGVSAGYLAKKFGFAYASTDYRQILADQSIGSVIITTPHHLHAAMVIAALEAGKHVLVEKPLCLTGRELEAIKEAFDGSRLLMVGFNRRFAPLALAVKAGLSGRTTPLVMTFRVNAGYIPEEHWVHDPGVGGGRLLGEVCHFIDFLQFMTDSEAASVSVETITNSGGKYRSDDNLAVTLAFKDGSIGTILYTAKGPKAFSRERFEVFSEDSAGVIEDFRMAQIVRTGRTRKIKKFSMDMGYINELGAFFHGKFSYDDRVKLFQSYFSSTRATLAALESAQNSQPINLFPLS
jgi:predicted dehydrogenase/threonine dehydrogenase-like Zn-dependent dehydrogenase